LQPLDKLTALVKPPSHPLDVATDADWARAEAQIGFRFPSDLVAVNRVYGRGFFDDFIVLLNPVSTRFNVLTFAMDADVLEQTLEGYHDDVRSGRAVGLAFEGLVPIGYTINGDELFFCRGAGRSLIMLAGSRGSSFELFESKFSDLLLGLLHGTIRAEAFPENFPSPHPRFVQK
jgi:hypothetical protein